MARTPRATYSVFARDRIYEKLRAIQRTMPAKGQEAWANDITRVRKHTFDRKYFQRLKSGTLSDARVNDIVEWIKAEWDSAFDVSLKQDEQIFTDPANARLSTAIQTDWTPLSNAEARGIVRGVHFEGLPESVFETVEGSSKLLPFLPSSRAIRLTLHRPGSIEKIRMHLLESGGALRSVSGDLRSLQTIAAEYGSRLNPFSVIDFLRFYFEVIDHQADIHFVQTTADVVRFNQGMGASFNAVAEAAEREFGPIIELPSVQHDPRSDTFRIRHDCIWNGRYEHAAFEVGPDFTVRVLFRARARSGSLHELRASNTPEDVKVIDVRISRDLSPLIEALQSTATGAVLLKSLARTKAEITCLRSETTAYRYDPQINSIVHLFNPLSPMPIGGEALLLAYAIRMLDQEFIGLKLPGAASDMKEYATTGHHKVLDALIFKCRVALELQRTRHGPEALQQLERENQMHLYKAVEADAPAEELFDAYAKA